MITWADVGPLSPEFIVWGCMIGVPFGVMCLCLIIERYNRHG